MGFGGKGNWHKYADAHVAHSISGPGILCLWLTLRECPPIKPWEDNLTCKLVKISDSSSFLTLQNATLAPGLLWDELRPLLQSQSRESFSSAQSWAPQSLAVMCLKVLSNKSPTTNCLSQSLSGEMTWDSGVIDLCNEADLTKGFLTRSLLLVE